MNINIKTITTLFFILLTSFSVNTIAESGEEEFDQYNVEVLIFEQSHQKGIDGEQWRELEQDQNSFFSNIASLNNNDELITELPSSSLTLADTRARLENEPDYRVLYHKSWSQAVKSKDESSTILIEIPSLVGSVSLHKQRFVHFSADLLFNNIDGDVKLKESRRLKSKELHYFDHPLFGLLVRVVKIENDQI